MTVMKFESVSAGHAREERSENRRHIDGSVQNDIVSCLD